VTADDGNAHPSTDDLADLDAGFLDRGRASGVREHLAVCAACAEESAAFLAVRSALAGEADPGPVPHDVAERLDAALAVAAAERGLPVAATADAGPGQQPVDELSARRRALPRLLAAAAAVGVVGLGAWAALGGMGGADEDATTAGEAGTARELSTAEALVPDADEGAGAGAAEEDAATTESESLLGEPEAPAQEEPAAPPEPEAAPPPTEEQDLQQVTDLTASVAAGEATSPSGPPGCGEAFTAASGTGLTAAVPTTYGGADAVLLVVPGPGFGVHTGIVLPTCDALPGDELATVEVAS
jgi:hypothetical protein